MSIMKLTIFPVDFESHLILDDCLMLIALYSIEKGLGYRLNSSGAEITGSKDALSGFFEYIKRDAFDKMKNTVAIIASFKDDSVDSALPSVLQYTEVGAKKSGTATLENIVLDMIG